MTRPVIDRDPLERRSREDQDDKRERPALELVRNALAGLKFGEIVVAIHDGEIVQISRTEKIRPVKR